MKRIVVSFLSLLLVVASYGQGVEPNLGERQTKEVYILLTVYTATTRIEAKIDFGDGTKELYFADDNGRRRKFSSFFEPINILIKDGWILEHYTSFVAGSCQAIMKKNINVETEAKEGMKLMKD